MSLTEAPRANGHANGHAGPVVNLAALRMPAERDSGTPGDRFSFVYPHQIELKPRRWLVPSLIPFRGFGVFFGPSGLGKSFWIIHLALCVALGLDFLGKPSKRSGVVIVAAEDAEGIKFRVMAALKALGVEIDADNPVPLAIIPQAPDLSSSEDGDADALIDALQSEAVVLSEYGAALGLVIIDTYRDALPGLEENDSKATSAAVRTLRRIGDETGALVLVVSHTSKAGDGQDPRGSSALVGAADVSIGVKFEDVPVTDSGRPEAPQRVLWMRKQRNGPDAKGDQTLRWSYALERVELDLIGEDGEPEASCVVRVLGAPQTAVPKLKRLSDKARLVERAIVAILSGNRGKRPPPDVPCPADHYAVRIEDLREEARRLGISDAAAKEPAEAVRKAVARGKEELIAHNKIFEDDGWIWQAKQ